METQVTCARAQVCDCSCLFVRCISVGVGITHRDKRDFSGSEEVVLKISLGHNKAHAKLQCGKERRGEGRKGGKVR